MKIGIPKEIQENETRVSLVPQSVNKLTKKNIGVLVESGAGEASNFSDKEYEEAGAKITKDTKELFSSSDLIMKVQKPILKKSKQSIDE